VPGIPNSPLIDCSRPVVGYKMLSRESRAHPTRPTKLVVSAPKLQVVVQPKTSFKLVGGTNKKTKKKPGK